MASSAQQQQQQQAAQQHPQLQPPSCKGIRINSSSHEVFQTPTNLRARCMRVFHWTEGFAKRAEAGYRQFIGLKVCHQDWDCSVLMAPPAIEKVWQQHILDVHHYREACLEFCGQLIHHNPEDDDHYDNNSYNSSGMQAYKTRVQTTRRSLQEFYDAKTVDGEVWSFPVAMMADNLDHNNDSEDEDDANDEAEDRKPGAAAKRQRTNKGAAAATGVASPTKRQRVAPAAASASSSSSSPPATTKPTASSTTTTRSDPLTIFVRRYLNNINNNMEDDDGDNHNAAGQQQHQHHHTDLYFKLLPTTKMQKVFARFAVHYGLDPRSFVFFFGSKRIAMLDTPSSLGMIDGEMIYATQCAAVEEEEED